MKYALGNMLNGAGGLNADQLALDLQFAADKTLTARKGPTPVFTRASSGTFVGSNGLIQSAGNNVARFDHDPVTLASRGLLIEENRTNLLLRSELFNNTTSWSNLGIATTSTQTAPDGANTAIVSTEDTTTNSHTFYGAFSNNRPTPGNVACLFSVFIKAGSRRYVLVSAATGGNFVGMMVDTQNWTITDARAVGAGYTYTSSRLVDYGNGWYRAELAFTPPAASTVACGVAGSLLSTFSTTNYPVYLGNSSTFIAWGAQLETGSFATSYIPTTTSSVVRGADVCSISGTPFSTMWNTAEGTLFASGDKTTSTATSGSYFTLQAGATEVGPLMTRTSTALLGRIRNSTGTDLTNTDTSQSPSGEKKVAVTWRATSDAADRDYASGGVILAKTNPNAGTAASNQTTLIIGGRPSTAWFNGTISAIRYYKKRLTNAKLQTLTV